MAKNPEDKLVHAIKSKEHENFLLTKKPVLVQNNNGIFYGTLEKSDTRIGTALLSNGHTISPEKYLTYVQWARLNDGNRPKIGATSKYYEHDFDVVHSMAMQNTITDYATEGIAPYYIVASSEMLESNPTKFYSSIHLAPLLSLANVSVIIPIDETAGICEIYKDIDTEVPVIDTFNGTIFGSSNSGGYSADEEAATLMRERYNHTSYFGTTGVNNLVVVHKEKNNDA